MFNVHNHNILISIDVTLACRYYELLMRALMKKVKDERFIRDEHSIKALQDLYIYSNTLLQDF